MPILPPLIASIIYTYEQARLASPGKYRIEMTEETRRALYVEILEHGAVFDASAGVPAGPPMIFGMELVIDETALPMRIVRVD